jgi:DNA replication protein DnaC
MRKMTMPESLLKRMEFHSSYCDKHVYRKNGEDKILTVQKMVINGQVVCPRCLKEKDDAVMSKEYGDRLDNSEQSARYKTLSKKSIVSDVTILDATLQNYTITCKEQGENLKRVKELLERLKDGDNFNIILQGKQGAGKSHLGYSVLKELNEYFNQQEPNKMCLFMSVDDMFREIKKSFNDDETKFTEYYFVKLCSEADFLVLDDLGAESGAVERDKPASDYVQTILNGIMNARQNKTTITTTNITGETMFKLYGKRLVSRVLRRREVIKFVESPDKRLEALEF